MDELQKKEHGALVDPRTNLPRGFQNMENEDLIIPRIAIGQPTSKRVADGELKVGAIYNTVTGESYVQNGTAQLNFLVVAFTKSRRLWDKDNKDNCLCMSFDGRVSSKGDTCATGCPFPGSEGARTAYDWGEDTKGAKTAPACTLYFNYLSIIEPFTNPFPVSISMGRTSAKAAKSFNSFMMLTGQDIFARTYSLQTEQKENKKGRFHIFKVRPIGLATPAAYKLAEELAIKLSTTKYTIHEEGASDENIGGAGGSDDQIPF